MKLEHKDEEVADADMKRYRNGEIWDFEHEMQIADGASGVVLGLDGGTTSTVCICMPIAPSSNPQIESLPVLARAVAGCSNHNSVGGNSLCSFFYKACICFLFLFFSCGVSL